MKMKWVLLGCALLAAGSAEASIQSQIARNVARKAEQRISLAYKRDALRDASVAAKPMARDRVVYRYVSPRQAKEEMRYGIAKGSHLTATPARPGRPLTAKSAAQRYGLQAGRDTRLTVAIPKGHMVKMNKAVGGERGWGEIKLNQHLPPSALGKSTSLQSKALH